MSEPTEAKPVKPPPSPYRRGAAILIIPTIAAIFGGLHFCQRVSNRNSSAKAVGDFLQYQEEQRRAEAERLANTPPPKAQLGMLGAGMKRTPLATALGEPESIAANADYVAWIDRHAGEIASVPRAGGNRHIVATNQRFPRGSSYYHRYASLLVISGGYAWWTVSRESPVYSHGEYDDTDGSLRRAPIEGGETETVLAEIGVLSAIAVEKDTVYYATTYGKLNDGGKSTKLSGVYRLAVAKNSPTTTAAPKASPTRIAALESPCSKILLDDSFVYTGNNGAIVRAPKSGAGTSQQIAVASGNGSCAFAVDATSLYWTNGQDVFRAKKTSLPLPTTATPTTIASFPKDDGSVIDITVDAKHVYMTVETISLANSAASISRLLLNPLSQGDAGTNIDVQLGLKLKDPDPVVTNELAIRSVITTSNNNGVLLSRVFRVTDGSIDELSAE